MRATNNPKRFWSTIREVLTQKTTGTIKCLIDPENNSKVEKEKLHKHVLWGNLFLDPFTLEEVLIDLRKAFDTVSHPHLIDKLSCLELNTHTLNEFSCYLSNICQRVK